MRLIRGSGASIVLAGVYLALTVTIAMVRLGKISPHLAVLLSGLSIAVLMLAQLAFAISIIRLGMRPRVSALVALLSATGFAGLLALLRIQLHVPVVLILGLAGLQSILLITFAVSLGYTVSFIVREPNILLPAAVFAALVDYWNVTLGPLSHILEKKPQVVEAVSVQMPTVVAGIPGTMIGMGDFVFYALFFGVLCRFSMNVKGAFWLSYGLLTASMLLVMKHATSLPALVPLGLAVLGANIRNFKLKREELLATVYVGALLLVLLVASGIYMHTR